MSPLPVPAWSASSPEFRLTPGEIHVWRADLDLPPAALAECRETLNAAERARADRLLRAEDRLRFMAARGLLRRLLGWYLQAPPDRLEFSYRERGKPFLAGVFPGPIPHFSLSHCREQALFAFALDRELGVDVEGIREEVDGPAILRRYFHPKEFARLEGLTEAQGRREFFRLWTRKEAWLKARGEGLSEMDRLPEADLRFRVVELDLGEAQAAALAYEDGEARLRLFRWA